ncbi:MAG TPA: hypothetical protein VHV10_09090 [Ktedonobacteraceae bacterium]|jgi:hypothetical protein|nr:hypothetical protein [Ktedonobacteraceae bacterium]
MPKLLTIPTSSSPAPYKGRKHVPLLVVTGLRYFHIRITKDTIVTGYSIGKASVEKLSIGTIGNFVYAGEGTRAAFDGA